MLCQSDEKTIDVSIAGFRQAPSPGQQLYLNRAAGAVKGLLDDIDDKPCLFAIDPVGLGGYRMQLHQAEIAFDESLVIAGAFTLESGGAAADKPLDLKQRPTAAFFFNDEMAIGAIQRLASRHIRVPEDMSIAGFDDIPSAAYADPSLTTIYQPAGEMGRRQSAP